jgi:hypothetical protein
MAVMPTLNAVVTANRFYAIVAIRADAIEDGLPRLRTLLERESAQVSLRYEERHLMITLDNVDALNDKELFDRVHNACVEAFPYLSDPTWRISDYLLGELLWDDELQKFEGQYEVDGQEIAVRLSTPPGSDHESSLQRAREVVQEWDAWMERIRPAVVQELLSIYNEEWRPHDERGSAKPIDEDAFWSRLSLSAIEIDECGTFGVYFEADGMFNYYWVRIWVTPTDELSVIVD